MTCKIAQNGGIMCAVFSILVIVDSLQAESVQTIQEYCSRSSYIHSIEPGQEYQLKLASETSLSAVNKWYHKSKRKCFKEFWTHDPSSHFVVRISNMTIPSCSQDCQCNYFEISVAGQREKYCGENKSDLFFVSKSDCLSLYFVHGMSMAFDVTFTFTVERNAYIITSASNAHYYIETPYFPLPYPSQYTAEYILQSNDNEGCVLLLFLDYQISSQSSIEVLGHNGTSPAFFYGDIFRPPPLISQKQRLSIKFEANNQASHPGFRAVCSFLKKSDIEIEKPHTDCGGLKDGRKGSIILKGNEHYKLYDCVWNILPLFPDSKSYLSTSILAFENIGPKALLEFREGLHSKSKLIKSIDCKNTNCSSVSGELTVSASVGFYIRFSGYLDEQSTIIMAYSTYHTGNCSDKELDCHNGRCLQSDLQCDGIKHCPDGSDEICIKTKVPLENTPPTVMKKWLHKESTSTAFTAVFVFGLTGIIITIILLVFVFIHKFKEIPPVNAQIPPPQVITEMTDVQFQIYPQPSNLDCLPSYDDFLKSTDQYPPLLYTRSKRYSEPINNYSRIQHINFCNVRVRHHSADSYVDVKSSSSSDNMTFERISDANSILSSEPGCSFHQNNMEWAVDNTVIKTPKCAVRRAKSLDSKLSEVAIHSTCHLLFSIVHPVCPHTSDRCTQIHCHTLPTNFKVNELKTNTTDSKFEANAKVACALGKAYSSDLKEKCHWFSSPHDSAINSEVLTMVKTRCNSDPCKKITVHYSYREGK